jgi:hypothetical protein
MVFYSIEKCALLRFLHTPLPSIWPFSSPQSRAGAGQLGRFHCRRAEPEQSIFAIFIAVLVISPKK